MKVYEGANIRNVALVGHGHAGKTTLVSAMLYTAGATQRLGRVDDGTATTDYDEEEIARKMSISASLAYVEWGKTKINFSTPPASTCSSTKPRWSCRWSTRRSSWWMASPASKSSPSGSGTTAKNTRLPRMIVVSRMDRERADAEPRAGIAAESLRTDRRSRCELPIGSEKNLSGVVDLVRMKAYTYELGGNGKGKEGEIPANMKDQAQAAHERLVELVAEGNDELMEEFFEKGTIPEEHLVPALHDAIREDKIFPVLFSFGPGQRRRRPS